MPKVVLEYKEEAKRRIVKHAMKLFSERGYYQTRMIDIANSMGVSKGAIYQYFSSKYEILIAVLEAHTALREQEVRSFLDSGLSSLATGEFFDRMLAIRMSTPPLGPDIFREAARNKSLMEWFRVNSEKWLQDFVGLLNEQKKDGVIRSGVDTEPLARGILALRDGLYSSLSLGTDIAKARTAWVEIMRILLKENLDEA